MMSSDIESRAIRLEKIGQLDEGDLRDTYLYLGKDVVEAVLIPEGQDFAVVIFTDKKFVTEALRLDHGDIVVSQPCNQVFSEVSATIHEIIPRAIGSKTLWKIILKYLITQYGVDIRGLVIRGSWLQVELCMYTLRTIYNERLEHDKGTHGDATREKSATGSKEQGLGATAGDRKRSPAMTDEPGADGAADTDSAEEPLFVYHGNRHGAAARESCDTGEPLAEAVPGKTYQIASTRVHVYMADITKLSVDVIVNASNEYLDHGGGVAGAIARAAGPDLDRACSNYILERGHVAPGYGVMTTSGALPCRGVFHVVGPRWSEYQNKNECRYLLQLAFTNCLRETGANGDCSSIAIPAISSGIFGVPVEWVAQVMCDTVTNFSHGDGRHSSLKDIHLVDINGTMVRLVQRNFDQHFKSEPYIKARSGISGMIRGVRDMASNIMGGVGAMAGAMAGARAKESDPEEDPCSDDASDDRMTGQDGSHDLHMEISDDEEKYGRNSAMSDHSRRRDDTKSASGVSPSSGHPGRLYPDLSDEGRASERDARRKYDKGTSAAKDHRMKSHATAAQDGATRLARNDDPNRHARKTSGAVAAKGDRSEKDDDCPICMDKLTNPKELSRCKHKFCKACIDKCFMLKQECPVCRMVYGKIQGTQPKDGKMDVVVIPSKLPGFSCKTCVIDYSFRDGIQTKEHPHPGRRYHGARRTAYLPDNTDGRRILGLLKKAFDQRLIFTVGRSVTTGVDDCVTWNDIHHKTSQDGGPDNYGYPDPGYLKRLEEDLAAKGIK